MTALDRPEMRHIGISPSAIMPDGWSVAPLKRYFRVVGGATPTDDAKNWDGDIPWVTPGDLSGLDTFYVGKGKRSISERGYRSCGTQLVPGGSVIVSTRAPIGSLAIAQEPLCTNQGCKALVPTTKVDSRFFAYALSVATPQLNALGQGSTFRELSGESLGAFLLAVPSHQEQCRIATFLDHETAWIDKLIKEKERLLGLLREKWQVTVSRAVTKGLNTDARMRPTSLVGVGAVPAHWGEVPLKYVTPGVTVGIVVTPSAYYAPAGVPVLRSLNVRPNQIALNNLVYMSEEHNHLHRKSMLRTGDVVVVRTGQPGTAAVVESTLDGCNCVDLIIIRRSPKFDSQFLAYLLNSDVSRIQVAQGADGAIQQHFNVETAKSLRVALPPISEQRDIVAYLDEIARETADALDQGQRLVALLSERRAALVTAAVTGQIDLRAWRSNDRVEEVA